MITNLRLILILPIFLSVSCQLRPYWWEANAQSFRISAAYQTSETLYDSIRTPKEPARPFRFPIVMQNDSHAGFYFAKYDSDQKLWTGEGLTVSIVIKCDPKLQVVAIDYSPLSHMTLLPGGESEREYAAWVTVRPDSSLLLPGHVKKVSLDVEVTWRWQDQQNVQSARTWTAHCYPNIYCVGEIAPRIASTPGE